MVTQFGFSKKIGQVNYSNMGDGMNKPYSEETGREIDAEVKAIIGRDKIALSKSYALSRQMLGQNLHVADREERYT